MSFGAPWALLGLAALPVLWWLHRRLRRPPVRALPSLMFMQDEDEVRSLPTGRRLDVELLLALVAAALIVCGAADPRSARDESGRVLRVVLANDAASFARRGAVAEVRERFAAALRPRDRVVYVQEPLGDGRTWPRPSEGALLAAARAGEASARFVISDRLPRDEPDDVTWIAVGDPGAANQGIAAVSVEDGRLFLNVLNDADASVRLGVEVDDGTSRRVVPVEIPARAARPVLAPVVLGAMSITATLRAPDGSAHDDALRADDHVALSRAPLTVLVDAELPERLADHVVRALRASLTDEGLRLAEGNDAQIAFLSPIGIDESKRTALLVELHAAGEGAAVERARPARDEIGRGPYVRDLSTRGVDWVYPAGARAVRAGEEVALGDEEAPIVLVDKAGRVRLAPDPLRGEPAPVATPFWPLFVDNLVRARVVGDDVGGGFRAAGLLDADSSRLGRDVRPLDPSVVAAAPPLGGQPPRPLRIPLILGAVVCLLLLWSAPRIRRRIDGTQRAKTHGPAGIAGARSG